MVSWYTLFMAVDSRCEEFALHACKVYATARRLETMQSLTQPNIEKLTLDVTVDASVQEAVKTVIDREGRIDILVNNAGTLYVGDYNPPNHRDCLDKCNMC